MNLLSAYTAFPRPANYNSGQATPVKSPVIEQSSKAEPALEVIPATPSEDTLAAAAVSPLRDLPATVQSFLTTEDHDGISRVGRFLDIHA